jgi:hypothetical protein
MLIGKYHKLCLMFIALLLPSCTGLIEKAYVSPTPLSNGQVTPPSTSAIQGITPVASVATDTPTIPIPTDTPTASSTAAPTVNFTDCESLPFYEDFEDRNANCFVPGEVIMWDYADDSGNTVFQLVNPHDSAHFDIRFGPHSFEDGLIEYRFRFLQFDESGNIIFDRFHFHFGIQNGGESSYVFVTDAHPGIVQLFLNPEGTLEWTLLDNQSNLYKFVENEWYSVRVELQGTMIHATLTGPSDKGTIDLRAENSAYSKGDLTFDLGPRTTVQIDDVRISLLP